MKTTRNNVFETNSSSCHAFTFSDDNPVVTIKTLEMLGNGIYDIGFIVSNPEAKADFFYCTLIAYLVENYRDKDPVINDMQLLQHQMIDELRNIRKNISEVFANHGVNVIFDSTVSVNISGFIDSNDYTLLEDDITLAKMAYEPEKLFRFIYNSSKIEDVD